ncbi:endolysin [Vibrio phage F35 g1]
MEYQKETTHICKSATLAREYQFAGNVWLYFFRGRWNVSGNGVEWHNENLTPILRLNIGESSEQDPNGIGQHDNGAKLDAGKPMAGRLLGMFGNALMSVAEVGTFGAKKYTEGGWQHVEDGFKRYDDAGMRHFLKRGMGEELDPETELPHLAHEAWNALAKLELYLRDKKEK